MKIKKFGNKKMGPAYRQMNNSNFVNPCETCKIFVCTESRIHFHVHSKMVKQPDKKSDNTIFDDVFVEEPQPKSTGRSLRFKFTKYVSLELQRTSIITLVCIIYLTLGGYIFQELERPDAEENCKDKMRELNETLPGMLDRIGDSYYEMLVSLRTVNSSSETTANKFFEFYEENGPELLLNHTYLKNSNKYKIQSQNCNDIDHPNRDCWLELESANKDTDALLDSVIEKVQSAAGDGLTITYKDGLVEVDCPDTWNFIDSVYFCATIMTSIGYGSRAPSTKLGRAVCIIYSLIGILLTGGLMSLWSSYMVMTHKKFIAFVFQKVYNPVLKKRIYLTLYVIMFIIIFMIIPAFLFSYIEVDWEFFASFYFTFITLSTIGFGDYTPATADLNETIPKWFKSFYYWIIIFWMFLGIVVMNVVLNKMSLFISMIFEFGSTEEEAEEKTMKEISNKHRKGSLTEVDIEKLMAIQNNRPNGYRPKSGIAMPGFGVGREKSKFYYKRSKSPVSKDKILKQMKSTQKERLPAI